MKYNNIKFLANIVLYSNFIFIAVFLYLHFSDFTGFFIKEFEFFGQYLSVVFFVFTVALFIMSFFLQKKILYKSKKKSRSKQKHFIKEFFRFLLVGFPQYFVIFFVFAVDFSYFSIFFSIVSFFLMKMFFVRDYPKTIKI